MNSLRPQYFFTTKKNRAVAEDVEGPMNPVARTSSTYTPIALFNGITLFFGGVLLGRSLTEQSHSLCGCQMTAFSFLKPSIKVLLWYMDGSCRLWPFYGSGEAQ